MACVALESPPDLGLGAKYHDFKPWLLHHFYDHHCSYCVLRHEALDVEHHEPRKFAWHRRDDPSNLLLGCGRCNGPGGKGDYHPAHTERRTLPHDTSGHFVVDVRVDDFAAMFSIGGDGSIAAREGASHDRAAWNLALLNLTLTQCNVARRELLDLRDSSVDAMSALSECPDGPVRLRLEAILNMLLPALARRLLFFEVYGLPLPDLLRMRLAMIRHQLRTQEALEEG